MPGDAVWALVGGGGATDLVAAPSLPAYRYNVSSQLIVS